MTIELPALPYARDALAPHISEETLNYHYGKHHQGYVNKLNKTIDDSDRAGLSLEQLILRQDSDTFNNAAQIWNHSFYWNSMSPQGGGEPSGKLADAINAAFGDSETFKAAFKKAATSNFGSGWTWLVKRTDGSLDIINTDDADTPLTNAGVTPLLTVDVWEHAYYVDYRNSRGDYLDSFWKVVNWGFAESNLA
ncbi:MAG: superoxide dismutase [Fe] [Gammaproteobacteria bacterium]|nr:superoxide dismutase [Fe] [Gammaproteobacteria bacterium]